MGLIKLNGVDYWGSNYGVGILAPMIYSDEEREVGVWRDNKPLYQITLTLASGSLSTGSCSIPNTLSNVDEIVGYEGSLKMNNNSQRLVLPHQRTVPNECVGVQCRANADGTVTSAITTWNGASTYGAISDVRLTIQYTKTTDVAGSGNWNTDGIPTHHYSTNEQVIGTWLGQTLYERVFAISEVTVSANSWYEITSIDVSNISQLVSNKCLLTRNGMEWGLLSTQKSNNNKLNVLNSRNANIAFDTIVLQYTKTS